ncbi:MAG: hypothetical protein V7647_2896 [Acidobacteriota bacterium]
MCGRGARGFAGQPDVPEAILRFGRTVASQTNREHEQSHSGGHREVTQHWRGTAYAGSRDPRLHPRPEARRRIALHHLPHGSIDRRVEDGPSSSVRTVMNLTHMRNRGLSAFF